MLRGMKLYNDENIKGYLIALVTSEKLVNVKQCNFIIIMSFVTCVLLSMGFNFKQYLY